MAPTVHDNARVGGSLLNPEGAWGSRATTAMDGTHRDLQLSSCFIGPLWPTEPHQKKNGRLVPFPIQPPVNTIQFNANLPSCPLLYWRPLTVHFRLIHDFPLPGPHCVCDNEGSYFTFDANNTNKKNHHTLNSSMMKVNFREAPTVSSLDLLEQSTNHMTFLHGPLPSEHREPIPNHFVRRS